MNFWYTQKRGIVLPLNTHKQPKQSFIMNKNLRTKVLLCLMFLLPVMWSGCNKQDDGEVTAPITIYEKVGGTWNMLTLKMIDETAKSAGIKPEEMVITDQFNFGSFGLMLNLDESNQPTTFSVLGDAPELIIKEGYWDLDKSFPAADGTPIVITLYSDTEKTLAANQLQITSMPGATPQMELRLTHSSEGVAYMTYQYTLVSAN